MQHGTVRLGLIATLLVLNSCRMGGADHKLQEAGEGHDFVEGHATHFESLGTPYGGCGVPEQVLETPHYLALNVVHTPRDYTSQHSRPIARDDINGMFDRGRNCGRYVRVEIGDNCVGGQNSGAAGTEFCAGGRYQPDQFNGATLDFIVTDSCQDGNLWCRDDRYHVDLHTSSLAHFTLNGAAVPALASNWTNRKVRWRFIDSPYDGDIEIAFIRDAARHWPAIVITKLKRGIHAVEAEVGGQWQPARMISDNGQAYELPVNAEGRYKIRVYDAHGELLHDGRTYSFAFPCSASCSASYNKVTYTAEGGKAPGLARTPATAPSGAVQPAPAPAPAPAAATAAVTPGAAVPAPLEPSIPPPAAPTPSSASNSLKVTIKTKSSWQEGYCADLHIQNTGPAAVREWTLVLKAGAAEIDQSWNVELKAAGDRYIVTPANAWTRHINPGASIDNLGFCAKLPKGREPASVLEVRS